MTGKGLSKKDAIELSIDLLQDMIIRELLNNDETEFQI